jgi:hypothetical protein
MAQPNQRLQQFLNQYQGQYTTKQRSAILNGLELTERLEKYAQQSLGLMPHMAETKRNTIIWSPPGAGKTFTVKQVAQAANLNYIQYHGKASLNAFVMKMAKECYKRQGQEISVWIDDCDSFFSGAEELNFMKIVLDTDEPMISWDVNVGNQITKAKTVGDTVLADALEFYNNGGVGIEIPLDNCRITITTNKQLASKQDIYKKKNNIHEHAVRDRCNWRAFNIDKDEAWGWMASIMLSDDVFQYIDKPFMLTADQTWLLVRTFQEHWDNLSANSMRTVMEAGALLYNSPTSFADEFEQNYLK